MLYARRPAGERVRASSELRGQPLVCPLCREPVIPKCGEVVTHHFAHTVSGEDRCDPWSEGESAWHLAWKSRFPEDWCEYVQGPHRADVRTPDGWTIEFQRSSISVPEIREREDFWRTMRWVFDACEPFDAGRLRHVHTRETNQMQIFVWDAPRETAFSCHTTPYFDLGDGTLFLTWHFHKSLHKGDPNSMSGFRVTYDEFVARFHPTEKVAAAAMKGWR